MAKKSGVPGYSTKTHKAAPMKTVPKTPRMTHKGGK